MAKTYYHSGTQELSGIHTAPNPNSEARLTLTPGSTAASINSGFAGGDSFIVAVLTTATGEPGVADWPSGTYSCIFEVSLAGADITYGLRTAGAATGHFARVDSGLTSDLEAVAQTQALFSGTGVRVASVTWNPAAGSTTDRFECAIAATRTATHGNQDFSIVLGAPDADATNGGISEGPWTVSGSTNVTPTDLTVTGTANTTTSQVASGVQASAATGAAQNATVTSEKQVSAGEASGSVLVEAATRQVSSTIQAASVTGSVQPGALTVEGSALHVLVSASAQDSTVQTSGGDVNAVVAVASSVSEGSSRLVSVKAKTA